MYFSPLSNSKLSLKTFFCLKLVQAINLSITFVNSKAFALMRKNEQTLARTKEKSSSCINTQYYGREGKQDKVVLGILIERAANRLSQELFIIAFIRKYY